MNSKKDPSRRGGSSELDGDNEQRMPFAGLLPDDFTERLERLQKASGLNWSGLANAIGVDYKQMYRWRKGVEPSGGAMHALCRYASRIPGGLKILMGDGFQMTFFDN